MILLGVNIDHVATLRQARMGIEPDTVLAAAIAEQNGADQITIHLREDRRHIQLRDLRLLKQTIQTKINLEMAATPEMVAIALKEKPEIVTLVPEKREELTTEGGLNLKNDYIVTAIKELQNTNIEVSLFIEPDFDFIRLASKMRADAVEIHTGFYANLKKENELIKEIQRIEKASKLIKSLGLRVVAGHGLNYHNIMPLVELGIIEEFNIGHSIISRAVFYGLGEAVSKMKYLINNYKGK